MNRTERALINRKRKQKKRKIIMFLMSTAIVITTCTFNRGTYASFSDKTSSNVVVTSSKTEDLIKKIDFECYNDGCNIFGSGLQGDVYGNPINIKLQKVDNLSFDPIIYFSVEGDASSYILNINPVKLEAGKEISIPIRLKLTDCDLHRLLAVNDKYPLKGKIVVKYLNEYINVEKKIEFSKEYLIYKYFCEPDNIKNYNDLKKNNAIDENDNKIINSIINNNKEIKDLIDKQNKN